MKCANHLEADAVATCIHCGQSICSDCQVQLKGENYCKDCSLVKAGQAKKANHSVALAAILSFLIPGLGQIYNGQVRKGFLIFFTAWLVIPWVIGIIDAYSVAKKISQGTLEAKSRPGCVIAFAVGVVILSVAFFLLLLLAAIAIPNLLRARANANDAYAKAVVASISSAIESYRIDNNGNFPSSEASLAEAKPPYLDRYYNNKELSGYDFKIDLYTGGYRILAQPRSCSITGSKIYTMENGKVFSELECQKNKEEQ